MTRVQYRHHFWLKPSPDLVYGNVRKRGRDRVEVMMQLSNCMNSLGDNNRLMLRPSCNEETSTGIETLYDVRKDDKRSNQRHEASVLYILSHGGQKISLSGEQATDNVRNDINIVQYKELQAETPHGHLSKFNNWLFKAALVKHPKYTATINHPIGD